MEDWCWWEKVGVFGFEQNENVLKKIKEMILRCGKYYKIKRKLIVFKN